ncbi:glycosyltransferase family 4 protein [Nesterenkonia sandarakina]|uniref:D-inositol 3-phosphate glycosyltransferase n=1 Tax=Nesterenkonia sandarakina TaxID=272918 RepID=A0A2T0YEX7_9MICC|nr:glycosyltransferase family 4 protein [Nesterenkonia sandarakina]PRZ13434.1 glycosyl transferase family 4 [Nesterenkonia sandarakina]
MTPRAQLLTHSYWPERTAPQRRWERLVGSLRQDGWAVDVVTPAVNLHHTPEEVRGQGRFRIRPTQGPTGERLHRTPYILLRNSRAGRFASDLASAVLMVPRALGAPKPDLVIATVPALPTICAGWLVSRCRRVPLVVDMRDAWPELAREAGVKAGVLGMLMESAVVSVQRRAELVVTVTEGFGQRLRERGVSRVETISNGVALDQVPQLDHRTRAPGQLRIAYLGNHGESQALERIITAVAMIPRPGESSSGAGLDVTLRLIGSGTRKDQLRRIAAEAGALESGAVEFFDPVHGEEIWEHYRWADTALVSLRTDWASFAWTVPSKTFELLGLGKHITAAVTGEAAWVLGHAPNVSFLSGDSEEIAATLTQLAADPDSTPVDRRGRDWVAEYADLPGLGRRYAALLRKLLQEHTR